MTRARIGRATAALGVGVALAVAAAPAMAGERAGPDDLPAAWAALKAAPVAQDVATTPATVSAARTDDEADDQAERRAGLAFGAQKSYAIPAAELLGFAFLLNEVNRHTYSGTDYDSNLATIRHNLHSSWVVDHDPFTVNQLGHPYQGSMYHAFARSAGLDYWESLGYAFAGSALWEIAGERTTPSRNDQINTGIGGSFLGEILFRLANIELAHDDVPVFWREAAAAVISPSTGFNRLAFGDRFKPLFPSNDPI